MMFTNRFSFIVLLYFFITPAFGRTVSIIGKGGLCCPEITSIRPAIGSERLAPLVFIPTKEVSSIQSLAKPDAVIIPGFSAPSYSNIADMIVGRVPGVIVSGGGFNNYIVRIRGAMGPPLVVIDGMPFYQSHTDAAFNGLLQTIPTAEIYSIEILKSIAETAIYGGHAANGVIRINTKSYLHNPK